MYGKDAKKSLLSESFVGWGGEDNDFFGRMKTKFHIIRARDADLVRLSLNFLNHATQMYIYVLHQQVPNWFQV